MKLLLDTHILIWLMEDDPRITPRARSLIADAEQSFVSSVSIWEIAIKVSTGKLRIDIDRIILRMSQAGLHDLPVSNHHAKAVARLPLHHSDPFDRLLVAQAMTEPLHLLTADTRLAAYSELVIAI